MEELQPNKFRYSLQVGTETYVLPNAPAGWIEENEIKWSRSSFYYGMVRTFSVPLQFVLDGAWILRREFYTLGLKASVIFTVDMLNPDTWVYENKYTGSVDFSTFEDEENQVTVTVQESGISAQIKAYEGVKYTIPLNVDEAIDVELTPLKLRERADFVFMPTDARYDKAILGLNLVINEVQALGDPSSYNVDFLNVNENPPVPLDETWENKFFYKAKIDNTINIVGNIQGSLRGGTGTNAFTISIYKYSAGVGSYVGEIYAQTVTGTGITNFNEDFTFDIPLLESDILYLITTRFPIGDGGNVTGAGFQIDEGEMKLTYFTGSPATFCKAIRGSYLFSQLLKKVNGGIDVSYQSFLLQEWNDVVFTSGDAIRGEENPTIISSFKDFFTSINACFNAGFGIQNNKAVLEKKSYWFQSLLKASDVGAIKTFKIEPYEPYMYNSLKIGYPDQQFSTILDNNDEVNSTAYWSLPIVRIQKEFDLLSVYRADPYGIEDTRITPVGSSNNNNNNDVFMINIKSAPETGETYFRPLTVDGYSSISGVIAAETYYNYKLSPKSNLLRHGDYLHSILDKYDTRVIAFESGLKNTKMSVSYGVGNTVTENTNITIGTLPDKIFLPYLLTIDTKMPKNISSMMQNFSTGYIRTNVNETDTDGFIIDASAQLSTNENKEFKLLLTPYNQMENFIR